MTDWTQVKPGTKVRACEYSDTPVFRAPRGVFIGATSEGNPVIEVDSGAVFAYGKDKWEPIPTTYTLTLTGPTGDSESRELSHEALEVTTTWTPPKYDTSKAVFDLCAALLAREEK